MEITLPISPQPSRWLPLLLAIAIFMQMLDATILNTALPNIAADLDESPLDMHSAVVVYTLTVALLIPLSGYLADRFGTRNVFVGSMAVFIAGSLLCAAAQNLPMLVVARMVQGVGGSMLAPVPRLTIIRVYEKSQLLNAINYAVMPVLIGPIFGPPVGGYLVEYASWHWIFLLNVPIGLIGIAAALKIMPNVKGVRVPFDTMGFLMFASAACALIMAVEVISHPQAVPFAAGPLDPVRLRCGFTPAMRAVPKRRFMRATCFRCALSGWDLRAICSAVWVSVPYRFYYRCCFRWLLVSERGCPAAWLPPRPLPRCWRSRWSGR